MAFLKTNIWCLALVLMLFSFSCEAKLFVVGGNHNSWKIPSSPGYFNNWAKTERFLVGDYLVFKYEAKADSVLQVDEEAYKSCDVSKPLKSYNNGETRIELEKSGPFFFISGNKDNCEKGEKLEVLVLHTHHRGSKGGSSSASPAVSPAASPVISVAPAPAPANGGDGLRNGVMSYAIVFGGLVGLVLV